MTSTLRAGVVGEPCLTTLALKVLAEATWPEPGDGAPPPVAGFVLSSFNPLVAAVTKRCLARRPDRSSGPTPRTAVVLASSYGDVTSAVHVASTVDTAGRVGPLLFFQSVPNAIAGYVAAREELTGPVVCTSPPPGPDALAEALAEAELLIADGDADEALVVLVLAGQAGDPDHARAVLVAPGGDE